MVAFPHRTALAGRPRIVGRSSSHFTRVVRMLAEECGVAYDFQIVASLASTDADQYGGNPGLRLPNVVTRHGPVFGSLGGCRALAALSAVPRRIAWPEDLPAIAANALELSVQAMSTEVTLIMLELTGVSSPYVDKLRRALEGQIAWLDAHVDEALGELPDRDVSYLELSLFCLLEHLEFRQMMPLGAYRRLLAFRDRLGERASATATPYRFDV